MNRRDFLKWTVGGAITGSLLTLVSGCIARINESVYEKDKGSPWRCTNCGYLTRSEKNLSDTRCPRCFEKDFEKITEEQLKKYIEQEKN